jgi:hypothetical protein
MKRNMAFVFFQLYNETIMQPTLLDAQHYAI